MYSTYNSINTLSNLNAFPTSVNDQITDSVTQSFFVQADIPAYSYSTYKTSSCGKAKAITEFEDEVEDGYKIIANVAGAAKESVTVNYIPEDNIIRLNAEVDIEDFEKKINVTYRVPCKFNLDELKCSLKNGLLTITIPYKEKYKPKEAKIS